MPSALPPNTFIILNGPLGIGKSTLAEALTESIPSCVMLDGDQLVAVNPEAADPTLHLHSTIELLVAHHRGFGYRHFVIDHLWTDAEQLFDLRRRLARIDPQAAVHCFLLTLSDEENSRRIAARQSARVIDEEEFELKTVAEERRALYGGDVGLGEPFDVTAAPQVLVLQLLARLGVP